MKFFYYTSQSAEWLSWEELKKERRYTYIPVMIRFDKEKIIIILKGCHESDDIGGAWDNRKELKKYKGYKIIERTFKEIEGYIKGKTCSLKEIMIDEL